MTTDELDQVHLARQAVEAKIRELVKAHVAWAQLSPLQEELLRTELTENFRFWS